MDNDRLARRSRRHGHGLVLLLVLLTPRLARAAETDGRALEVSADAADVSLDAGGEGWWTARVQLSSRRAGHGGGHVAADLLRRGGLTDLALTAGGFRHLGGWTVSGSAAATPRADFHHRLSGEVELHRAVAAGLVAHTSYRRMWFPSATVDLVSPAVTWYAPRGEVQARLFLADDHARPRSRAWLARASWDVTPRVRIGGGLARGERIFDITHLAGPPARGWVAFAEAGLAVGGHDRLTVTVRAAREGASFDQQAIALRWRRGL